MLKSTAYEWQSVINKSFKLSILSAAILSFGFLTACSSTPTKTTTQGKTVLLDADSFSSMEDLLYATDMRAVEGDRLLILRHGDVWKRMTVGFKMDLNVQNSRIDSQRGWFISRQPYLDRLSARASRYIHYTVKEAERRGIPTELALLPIIESSYDPAATSSAAAAGLWQFIPSTGRIYGLRQSDLYDGRRDVVESTRAAYEYLTSLYNQFGSWELALASYNAGPGRIQQAINRNKAAGLPTDYWSLRLPTETMNYVPRFIAVAQIIQKPAHYGVTLPPIANRAHFREVSIPGSIDLNQLSALTGVSRGELYALNPAHRGNNTDPLAPNRVLIPNDVSASVDSKIAKMTVVSGSGGLWAGQAAPPPTLPSASAIIKQPTPVVNSSAITTQVTTRNPNAVQPSSVATPLVSSPNTTVAQATNVRQTTPKGSQALASFASNADIPSAPRLPVSIIPAANVKQIPVEPPISEAEKQIILAEQLPKQTQQSPSSQSINDLVQQIVEPAPSDDERRQVIAELEKLAPQGTEIIDPLDGKIRLTAIQSSQSVAEQKGEEVQIGFAYPKSVAEAEKNSEAVKRNAGKPVVETNNEVVVVPPKGKRELYTVQSGDTLANIAARFGVNWRDIAQWNQINADASLYVGTRLYLYDVKPVVEQAPKKPERYMVKPGDSLTVLSQQYDVSIQDLAAWNGLTATSNIMVGQRLTFIEPKDFKTAINNQSSKESDKKVESISYTVKRGEFLQQIAERYGISNVELAALTPNLTATSQLLVGQKINVPKDTVAKSKADETSRATNSSVKNVSTNIETTSYTVVSGDTLSNVASKHKIGINELASLNDLKVNSPIFVGQKLKVPQIEPKRPDTYRVQSGDTLTGIADKFQISVQDLAVMNNLKADSRLNRNQVLKLDGNISTVNQASANKVETAKVSTSQSNQGRTNSNATEIHTVKSGESLTVIANRYGISVGDLAKLNSLSNRASLQVGQKISVPKLTTTYKVKRGDNLIALARKYDLSVEELAEMNNIKADSQLRLGQDLTVPNN